MPPLVRLRRAQPGTGRAGAPRAVERELPGLELLDRDVVAVGLGLTDGSRDEVEDRVEQEPPEDRTDEDPDRGDDGAVAQLPQVVTQGHPRLGILLAIDLGDLGDVGHDPSRPSFAHRQTRRLARPRSASPRRW